MSELSPLDILGKKFAIKFRGYPANEVHEYLTEIAGAMEGLTREREGRPVPVILFSKSCNTQLEALAASGCDALGVDWTITLAEARQRVGDRVALQGNMDPAILLSDPGVIRREAKRTLESFGPGEGHVFNLGHGITPEVDPDHLGALLEAVQEFSPALHAGGDFLGEEFDQQIGHVSGFRVWAGSPRARAGHRRPPRHIR